MIKRRHKKKQWGVAKLTLDDTRAYLESLKRTGNRSPPSLKLLKIVYKEAFSDENHIPNSSAQQPLTASLPSVPQRLHSPGRKRIPPASYSLHLFLQLFGPARRTDPRFSSGHSPPGLPRGTRILVNFGPTPDFWASRHRPSPGLPQRWVPSAPGPPAAPPGPGVPALPPLTSRCG